MHTIARLTLVAVLALAGCVANAPPTVPPTAPPRLSAAPPTAGPPTLPATTAASSPASVPAPSATIADFWAHTALFADSFDDPSSGWGTGATAGGDVRYADGQLVFETAANGSWMWSKLDLPAAKRLIRLEVSLSSSGTGYQGLLCGGNDAEVYGGVVKTDGRWVFMRLTGEGSMVLQTGVDARWTVGPSAPRRIALDCAGAADGSLRMQLSLPDASVAVVHEAGPVGPPIFDRVGIYAEAASEAFSLHADNVAVFSEP